MKCGICGSDYCSCATNPTLMTNGRKGGKERTQ